MLFKYQYDTNIRPKTAKSLIALHKTFNIITIMRKARQSDPLAPTPSRCMCSVPHKYFLDFSQKKCDTE